MSPAKFIAAWEAAVHQRSVAALEPLLAPDLELISPVVHRPIQDPAYARKIFAAILQVLPDLTYERREPLPGGALLVFRGHLDGLELQGIDLFDLNDSGQARRLTVMVRPLRAATAFAQAMAKQLELPAT